MRRSTAFAAALALTAWLALEGGGFDLVFRQQVGLIVWWALALGFLVGWLPRSRPSPSLLWPALGLVGLIAWMLLSMGWTSSDESTFAEVARVVEYAGFVVAAWVCLNRYTFRAAAAGISVAVLGVAVLALLSRLAPASFPVDEIALAFDVDRLSYPFDYWNAVAAWGCMAIAIGLVWSAHARTPVLRGLAAAAVPAATLAVYLTYSRAGVVGAVLAVLAAVVLSRNRWTLAANGTVAIIGSGIAILVARGEPAIADATGGEGGGTVFAVLLLIGAACAGVAVLTQQAGLDRVRLGRMPRPLAAAGVAAGLVAAAAALAGPGGEGWDQFLHEDTVAETASGSVRLTTLGGDRDELWGAAADAFSGDTLTGIGPGSFDLFWARDGREPAPVEDAHSLYLETLAELGLPGLLLLLVVLGGLWAAALVARRDLHRTSDIGAWAAMLAASAVFLVHAGVDWMWEYPALVIVGLGGLAVASAANLRRGQPGRGSMRSRVAIVAACLLAGVAQIPGLVSNDSRRASERALAAGDPEAALEFADDAARAEPWAASPLSQRALAEEQLGDLEAARDDLADAREREPDNWLWAAQLARVESSLGNEAAAARAAAEARALNKVSPIE